MELGVGNEGSAPVQTDILGDSNFLSSLPPELQAMILACLSCKELFQALVVCKGFSNVINCRTFHQVRARRRLKECSLSPLVFYEERDSWHVKGFDYENRLWRKLPPFKTPIPAPDPDFFKNCHVSADQGLFCVNVGKGSGVELYVTNLLTAETSKLPGLKFSRHPVIINVHVRLTRKDDIIKSSFRVIAIGSAAIGTEGLSRKTEIYDSKKGSWEPAGDVPGAGFSLKDYQTGVYCENLKLLLCVGFMVNGSKGILAFDVEKRKWREDWICPFYHDLHDPVRNIVSMVNYAQLFKCSGSIYLFSEQQSERNVAHCIDRLDLDNKGEGFTWTRVVTPQWQGNRALRVYPEHTCVPVEEDKACIFNTIKKTGTVYDLRNVPDAPATVASVPCPDMENGMMFLSLNPVAYAFEPSFVVSPSRSQEYNGGSA